MTRSKTMDKTTRQILREELSGLMEGLSFDVLIPPDSKLGDYSTNIAFVLAKKQGNKPADVAGDIKNKLSKNILAEMFDIQVAPNGFLNFYAKSEFLQKQLEIIYEDSNYGKNKDFAKKTIIVEYTDPNPFKLFHIGHLMPNIIGEAVARLYEFSEAKVVRVNYQGDVGLHVAKAIWAMKKEKTLSRDLVMEKIAQAYSFGSKSYEDAEEESVIKDEINEINQKIYDKSDSEINELYQKGREESLNYFDNIYKKLGTKFDHYFFESEVGPAGLEIVKAHPDIFVAGENGAVIFRGEDYGFHTRVFVNAKGLPTYETKELGVNKDKFDLYHPDLSVIVTGNEINDYFKVLLKVMELTMPEVASRTKHVGHGMLRLTTGKMSSRTGDVITAESLIEQTISRLPESTSDKNKEKIAVGAIKYSILRQGIGQDIIFDFEKSLSVSGDAGPYLQYTYARLHSILLKAGEQAKPDFSKMEGKWETVAMKYLLDFPDSVRESVEKIDPHYLTGYLYWLAVIANQFYENVRVLDDDDIARRDARLILIKTVARTLKDGLGLLGIETLERI
ncbi:MAG: arginine--tRNA ligase [Candidatus Yanofskybacteria bacterium RIFCSPHIGHO2_01_FULL_41_21]|uniref:Arginine--tRNA ligase n=1 Tax=Candidatus Yanofskybacteria bacterium RIFCSPHIGHO2_01_FULL_41_21 TaxID=1802660 RepID=A0A1F8EAJ4_9BACT|nr:MAG: arginine--tRNA ligase [Candidatus Yanofskybacteria bacterium RIFCSPHIGHO2_01_FULL_41_21]